MPSKSNPTDPGQGERFIEAARKSGADESGKSFERAFKKIVPRKNIKKQNSDRSD
jgi:hypothetical protein